MTLHEWTVASLVFVGSVASLIAAIGIVRMPDLYTRMQSATKAGTLGVACAALAVAVHFGEASVAVQALLVIVFLFSTAPIASHLIARAAYGVGVPLWGQTTKNELDEARRAAAGSADDGFGPSEGDSSSAS